MRVSRSAGRASHRTAVSLTLNEFSFDSDPALRQQRFARRAATTRCAAKSCTATGGFYVGPTFDLVGKRFADFANTYEVGVLRPAGPARRLHRPSAGKLFAELRNLLDEDYIATVNVLNEAGPMRACCIPGAPVSAYAGVRLKF